MQSAVLKRSIVVDGHKTSVSLEDAFWNCLKEIAGERHTREQGLEATD
jgi:predicted DNA-binding ribbon-helix-helix protein